MPSIREWYRNKPYTLEAAGASRRGSNADWDSIIKLHSHFPALVVAASNAPEWVKDGADIVCDGTADEEEINAAITTLLAGVAGKVALTEGTYQLTTKSVLMGAGVLLEGDGYATLIQYDGDTLAGDGAICDYDGTTARTVTYATVRDLRVKNTGSTTPKPGVQFGWTTRIPQGITIERVEAENCALWIYCGAHHRIENCYVHDLTTAGDDCGITIRGEASDLATDSIIAHNIIETCYEMGIASGTAARLTIVHNRIKDCAQTTPSFAIDVYNTYDIVIEGNGIESLHGINSEDCAEGSVEIVNNQFKGIGQTNADGYGIQVLNTGSTYAGRVLVEGNTITNCFRGINIDDEDKVAVLNNLIDLVGGDGIYVSEDQGTDPSAVTIAGNTVLNWANHTDGAYASAILASVANVTVEGNYCKDVASANNSRGISDLEAPGSILNNTILGNAETALYNIEAGVTVRNNPGNLYLGEQGILEGWVAHDNQNPSLGTIPANCIVTQVQIHSWEAFDSDGTDLLTVGYDADVDSLVTALDVSAAWTRWDMGSAHANAGARLGFQEATERAIEAYYVNGGTEPSAGRLHIVIHYVQGAIAP